MLNEKNKPPFYILQEASNMGMVLMIPTFCCRSNFFTTGEGTEETNVGQFSEPLVRANKNMSGSGDMPLKSR